MRQIPRNLWVLIGMVALTVPFCGLLPAAVFAQGQATDTSLAARLRPRRPDAATAALIMLADAGSNAGGPLADSLRDDVLRQHFDGDTVWLGGPAKDRTAFSPWRNDSLYIRWLNMPPSYVTKWSRRAKVLTLTSDDAPWGRVELRLYEMGEVRINGDIARVDYRLMRAPVYQALPTREFWRSEVTYYLQRRNGRWVVIWQTGTST